MEYASSRTLGLLVNGALILAMAACSSSNASIPQGTDARFVGMWDLVTYHSFPESGQVVDQKYTGRLIYDASGNMAAIGMPLDLPDRLAADPESTPRAGFAYFGGTTVFAEEGRIVHHVTASPMSPAWVGTDMTRYFEFEENRLMLSLRNAEGRVTGTLTWRKME